jgi:hypothetical protein
MKRNSAGDGAADGDTADNDAGFGGANDSG